MHTIRGINRYSKNGESLDKMNFGNTAYYISPLENSMGIRELKSIKCMHFCCPFLFKNIHWQSREFFFFFNLWACRTCRVFYTASSHLFNATPSDWMSCVYLIKRKRQSYTEIMIFIIRRLTISNSSKCKTTSTSWQFFKDTK